MLKEKADIFNIVKIVKKKMISKEHIIKPRLRAISNEHAQNEVDNNKVLIESKEKKEDNWIMPKCMPIDYFCKKYSNKG